MQRPSSAAPRRSRCGSRVECWVGPDYALKPLGDIAARYRKLPPSLSDAVCRNARGCVVELRLVA
jgi:hypothetical protein